ncbi:MAG TPA: DNA primase [Terriglobales bacterium]|nr:DNA primase [Terriglobales bacterium]
MTEAGDFKELVKQQADIVRIVGDYVKLKKVGAQNFAGLCPFHKEKTPSFSVHATRQFFHCFGCGTSGDVFSFVEKIENISFPEALRAVAQKLNIPLPKTSYGSPAEAREASRRAVLLEIHGRASSFFEEYLRRPEGAHAREYLAGRGLEDDTIRVFHIGYAPDSGFLLRDRLRAEFDEDLLRDSGLFSWKEGARPNPEVLGSAAGAREQSSGAAGDNEADRAPSLAAMYAKFRNRVMFPITNDAGRVIAFTGRTLSSDEKAGPKYLNSPETAIYSKSRVLFNLDRAKEAIRKLDYAILVEGQMDCISVYAAGFHNVIASSGTAFTELQAKLLARFSKNVVVNFDPDTAGAKATERTLALLVEEEFQLKVVSLDPGFDPDLFVRRKGRDAYAEALRHAKRYFDYLIERARVQFPVRSAEGKVKAVNYLLPHIQRVPSRIIRDELAGEIAQKLSVDSAVLRQELKHVAATRSSTSLKASLAVEVSDAEKIVIRALSWGPPIEAGRTPGAGPERGEEGFNPARQARLALADEPLHLGLATESILEALLHAPEGTDVLSLPLSDADRNRLASILMKEDEELTAERLEGGLRALRRIRLRRKLEEIQTALQAVGSQDPGRRRALLEQKVRLKRALMDPGLQEQGSSSGAA